MKIFVINLPDSVNRRESISKQLAKTSLAWEFFPAFDGRSMSKSERDIIYDSSRARMNVGREMSSGEIGCAMSHRLVYKKMIKDGIDQAIVLEDDVILRDGFENLANALSINSPHKSVIKLETDFDKLPCSIWGKVNIDAARAIKKPVTKKYFLAAGYWLDNAAAHALYEHSDKIIDVSDHWDYYRKKTGVKIRILSPGIVSQDRGVKSDIWKYESVSSVLGTKKRYPRGINFFVKQIRKIDLSFFRQFLP